jgi:hypothetical protein
LTFSVNELRALVASWFEIFDLFPSSSPSFQRTLESSKNMHSAQRTKPCCPATPEYFDKCAGFQLSLE